MLDPFPGEEVLPDVADRVLCVAHHQGHVGARAPLLRRGDEVRVRHHDRIQPVARLQEPFQERSLRQRGCRGTVLDAETDQPINRFSVLLDERRGLASADFVGEGRNGVFDWEYPALYVSEYALEVQADGYMPEASAPVKVSAGEQVFAFKLKKTADFTGRVLFPDGTPAVGTEVWLGGEDFGPIAVMTALKQPALHPGNDDWSIRTRTDAEGIFRFKPRRTADRVVAVDQWGCVAASLNTLSAAAMVLKPWGRIRGVVWIGTRAGLNCTVGIEAQEPLSGSSQIPYAQNVRTDNTGVFTFERAPPGKYRLFRVTSLHGDSPGFTGLSHYTSVEVLPGETAQVAIGGGGRTVVGRVQTVPDNFVPYWTTLLQTLAVQSTETPPRAPADPTDQAGFRAYHRAWRSYDARQQRYYFGLNPDGSFVVEDVVPGNYRLQIGLSDPPADPLDPESAWHGVQREIGSLTCDVLVPEAPPDAPDQPLDLGTYTLQVKTEKHSEK